MSDPGTVYFTDGTKEDAVHVDVRKGDDWVYYQTRVDGHVYSNVVPKREVEKVKWYLGTVGECKSAKNEPQGAHPHDHE